MHEAEAKIRTAHYKHEIQVFVDLSLFVIET
jgi:hypothetical protein